MDRGQALRPNENGGWKEKRLQGRGERKKRGNLNRSIDHVIQLGMNANGSSLAIFGRVGRVALLNIFIYIYLDINTGL